MYLKRTSHISYEIFIPGKMLNFEMRNFKYESSTHVLCVMC